MRMVAQELTVQFFKESSLVNIMPYHPVKNDSGRYR